MKQLRPWLVPSALAVILVAALFISPALGGPGFLTSKKLKKKVSATQVVSPGEKSVAVGSTEQLMLSMELRPGNYLVRTTFSLVRRSGETVTCRLRIPGVSEDASTSFADAPANAEEEESVAMETAGRVTKTSLAQLLCGSALANTIVRYAEITAEKVPKLTVTGG